MGRCRAFAKGDARMLDPSIRIQQAPTDHTYITPSQLTAHALVPFICQADHIIVMKQQQLAARMRAYRGVVHISPIEVCMTRDNGYAAKSFFNLVKSRLQPGSEVTIHNNEHLYSTPSGSVATEARNGREHHVSTVAGRYNHRQATARIVRPLDLDRIIDRASESVAMWNCLRTG